ncbi:MAG: hypothetical protein ACREJN_16135 [Nitrospiraceae bacterium]
MTDRTDDPMVPPIASHEGTGDPSDVGSLHQPTHPPLVVLCRNEYVLGSSSYTISFRSKMPATAALASYEDAMERDTTLQWSQLEKKNGVRDTLRVNAMAQRCAWVPAQHVAQPDGAVSDESTTCLLKNQHPGPTGVLSTLPYEPPSLRRERSS